MVSVGVALAVAGHAHQPDHVVVGEAGEHLGLVQDGQTGREVVLVRALDGDVNPGTISLCAFQMAFIARMRARAH